MADKDNVESNPVLAFSLAGVALIGVLGGLLPPGLLERMAERNAADSTIGAAAPSELAAPAVVGMAPDELAPASTRSVPFTQSAANSQSTNGPAGPTPAEPPSPAASLSPATTAAGAGNGPETIGRAAETGGVSQASPGVTSDTVVESSGAELPIEAPVYRRAEDRFRPPAPVYPQPVSPWGGYPGYGYPPVYDPYYGQPRR